MDASDKKKSKKRHATQVVDIKELNRKKKDIGTLALIKLPRLIQTKIRTTKALPSVDNQIVVSPEPTKSDKNESLIPLNKTIC